MQKRTMTLWLATISVLVACGGGSDGASPANPTTGGTNPPTGTAPPDPAPPVTNPPPSSAITAANSCDLPNFQTDVLAAVNAARAQARKCGNTDVAAAPAMRWNDQLFAASAVHSADMAAHNKMQHTGFDGSEFSARAERQGYMSASGENIAYSYRSVQNVMQAWITSEGHCKNIMSQGTNDVAVACVRSSNSTPYWTMVVGRS
jgi:uncharacterized protein YkwD